MVKDLLLLTYIKMRASIAYMNFWTVSVTYIKNTQGFEILLSYKKEYWVLGNMRISPLMKTISF